MDEPIQKTERNYFAASNSADGFINYYGACFGESAGVERLYVVKGGPGTGKSRFMRDVARAAEERGYKADYYYCSSDANSLDGVRLTWEGGRSRRLGIVDGTSPHAWEPSLPGVYEEIVNLGEFWDERLLQQHAVRIRQLNGLKKQCFDRAYHYLSGYGHAARITDSLLEPCVLHSKIDSLAERILRGQPAGRSFYAEPALQNSVGMTGRVHFDTFAREAITLYRMDSYYGVEYRVLDALLKKSKEKKLSVRVSWDPVCPWRADGLFWPDGRLAVVVSDDEMLPLHRHVYLSHYVDAALMKGLRYDMRYAKTTGERLMAGACYCFERGAGYHFELEDIYMAAMDFEAKEAFTKKFCCRVLG